MHKLRFFNIAIMSFNVICENRILTKPTLCLQAVKALARLSTCTGLSVLSLHADLISTKIS